MIRKDHRIGCLQKWAKEGGGRIRGDSAMPRRKRTRPNIGQSQCWREGVKAV